MNRPHLTLCLVLLAASRASAISAGEFITGIDTIPGEYFVVFNPGETRPSDRPDLPGPDVRELGRQLTLYNGGSVEKTYERAVQAVLIRASSAQARAIALDRRVRFVEQNKHLYPMTTQSSVHWGLDRIDERNLPRNNHFTYTSTGSGVNIYVIDSGVDANSAEFGNRLYNSKSFVPPGNPSHGDCNGHGTSVAKLAAGSISGVAKSAKVRAVRIFEICGCTSAGQGGDPEALGPEGCAFNLDIAVDGIEWVANNRLLPAVANLSFGANQPTPMLDTATQGLIDANVTAVVAAGNANANACNTSPARVGPALTVGGSNISDQRASCSNFGSCLDLFAPGDNIFGQGGCGTSFAAPLVAGTAAHYLQSNPGASPATVANYIKNNASTGKLSNIGSGSPNKLLFVPPGGTETDNPPTANFTCTCSGPTCYFTSTSTDDFAITECRYTLAFLPNELFLYGCGTVSYTYGGSGSHFVVLRVTDDGGQVDSTNKTCS